MVRNGVYRTWRRTSTPSPSSGTLRFGDLEDIHLSNNQDNNIRSVGLTLVVDDEGVVRVVSCDSDEISLTPEQLARLLTALIKSLVTVGGDNDATIGVNLN